MKVSDYLTQKYKDGKAIGILFAEAKIFGIPTPLESGWFQRYGHIEITPPMAFRLRQSLEVKAKKGKRFAEAALDAMDGLPSEQPSPQKPPKKKKEKRRKSGIAPNYNQATPPNIAAFIAKSSIDPSTPEFLHSFEWKALRMIALKKYGPVCQCCGASPATGATMNVDHIRARRFYPELALDIDNLQILCGDCNHGKGNWDTTDWRR